MSECVLCDICIELCPYVFKKNDAGYIEVVETDDYPEEDIADIIKSCRGDCIGWDEDA
ncbi:MAG: ferredoxin [Desulfobacterium sp.]|nr:ferredoxin [Desulfobacterium sp.]